MSNYKLKFNPLLRSGLQYVLRSDIVQNITDDVNLLKNETITQVYFEEVAAGTTTGQIILGAGVTIQEGFLGTDGDILLSGVNSDGFPNEETPKDSNDNSITASFTTIVSGVSADWSIDGGENPSSNFILIFAVTGTRQNIISWKNNTTYELWFDATESEVDFSSVLLQNTYDNSPTETISTPSADDQRVVLNATEGLFIALPTPQNNVWFRLGNENGALEFNPNNGGLSGAKFVSMGVDANFVYGRAYVTAGGTTIDASYGLCSRKGTILDNILRTTNPTLNLRRVIGQTENLFQVEDELENTLLSIDPEAFFESFNDVKLSKVGSGVGCYLSRTDGVSGSLISGSVAVAVRYDETGSFLFQTQSKSNIDDRNGVGVETQVSISNLGDVEIHDPNSGIVLRSPDGTRYRLKVDNSGNLTTELA